MLTRLTNGRIIDPANDRDAIGDLWIQDGRIVAPPEHGQASETIDVTGCLVMAGGIDIHTHVAGTNVNTARLTVTDLLALDPLNPRSILFQMNEIHREVEQLPNAFINGQMSPFYREAMRLHSGLAVMTPETMSVEVYKKLERELEALSDLLAQTYLG